MELTGHAESEVKDKGSNPKNLSCVGIQLRMKTPEVNSSIVTYLTF
jgi:hypothetical protein